MGNTHSEYGRAPTDAAPDKAPGELKKLAREMYCGLKKAGKVTSRVGWLSKKADDEQHSNAAISKNMVEWMKKNGKGTDQAMAMSVLKQMIEHGILSRIFRQAHLKDAAGADFKSTTHTWYKFNIMKIATHVVHLKVFRGRNLGSKGIFPSPVVKVNVGGEWQGESERKDGTEAPEWNRALFDIGLVGLEDPLDIVVNDASSAPSSPTKPRRSSLTISSPTKTRQTELLRVRLDLHNPRELVETGPAAWYHASTVDKSRNSSPGSDEPEGPGQGVQMSLLASSRQPNSYDSLLERQREPSALQISYRVEKVWDETSDVSGDEEHKDGDHSAPVQGFLSHLKTDMTDLATGIFAPSLTNWTIEARVLEVESMCIHHSGILCVELRSNGVTSGNSMPVEHLLHDIRRHAGHHMPAVPGSAHHHEAKEAGGGATLPKLEIKSVRANLASDVVDLSIFAKQKKSVARSMSHLVDGLRHHPLHDTIDLSSATIRLDQQVTNPIQRTQSVPERYEGDDEPEAKWYKLYAKHPDGHLVYNGRVKAAIWRYPTDGMRKRTFWLLRILRMKVLWFVILLLFMHQSGFLLHLLLYPFRALLWIFMALPVLFFFPTLLGAFLSVVVTKAGTFGFPITFGSLRLVPWCRNGAIHLQVDVEDFAFSNPPNFPRRDFLNVEKASIHFRFPLSLFSWHTIQKAREYRWSPFPSTCAELTGYNPDMDSSKGAPDKFQNKLGVLGIEHFEVNGVVLVFEIYDKLFNINGFSRLLAEGKAFGEGWPETDLDGKFVDDASPGEAKPLPPTYSPDALPLVLKEHRYDKAQFPGKKERPNCLIVQVVEGRNLDLTCKTMDPVVTVAVRHQVESTKPVYREHNPKWDNGNTFRLHVEDPSAVLHVTVLDDDTIGSRFVGQFVYTMKFFRVKPDYSWHCKGECDVRNAKDLVGDDFQIEGWFKLADKNFLNRGEPEFDNGHMIPGTEKRPGCIKLKMSWVYDKRFDKRTAEGCDNGLSMADPPPDMTALEQLQLNSAETKLRLGNPLLVAQMLDSFPLLLDVKRFTIRDVRFSLGDLFRGYGSANTMQERFHPSEAQAIYVDNIEIIKAFTVPPVNLKHKGNDAHMACDGQRGLTLWVFLKNLVVRGIAPVVGLKAAVLAQGSASILTSGIGGLMSLLHHASSGEIHKAHRHLHRPEFNFASKIKTHIALMLEHHHESGDPKQRKQDPPQAQSDGKKDTHSSSSSAMHSSPHTVEHHEDITEHGVIHTEDGITADV